MKLKRDIRRVADMVVAQLGSKELAAKWIFTENPIFGGLTPVQMISKGRKGKVVRMIRAYLRTKEG